MRKLLTMMLGMAIVMSMATVVFAETITTVPGSSTVPVTVEMEQPDGDPVYSVVVTWDALVFTYKFGDNPEWDPETHTYDTTNSTKAGWYIGDNYYGEEAGSRILVVNHSNAKIKVQAAWDQEPDWNGEISGKGGTVEVNLTSTEHVLESAAEGDSYGLRGAAPHEEIFVSVSGVPKNSESVMGEVIVTISAVD